MLSIRFELCEFPWHAPVIIFQDGAAKLNVSMLRTDKPVLVYVEGLEPTPEQLEACRDLWVAPYSQMSFSAATFCNALLHHSHDIMALANTEGPA